MSRRSRALPQALRRLLWRMQHHGTALVAAGCAFYATLALFPALSILVSLYGLLFDPHGALAQLELLRPLLPAEAFGLVAQQVQTLVNHPRGALGLSLLLGLVATFWSAASGTKSILAALNLAEGHAEDRGLLAFQAVGLALTLAAMLAAVLAVALLVALPAAIAFLGLSQHARELIQFISMALLLGFVVLLLAGLYRFGPARPPARLWPGAAAATVLWLAASWGFALLAARVIGLGASYGPLAAAAALMLWFWVSAYAALFGAELNAVLDGG